ncbi:hypothetical protein [Gordonia rhizosphera]|uniref:Uncharacterized protein n=1 Tax=Gordonia rhizosphera NBRC 16068 TaxID=1108045 RepID=K6V2N0_9ACTN|nr:hypothetical protein [Gordonia rhizosphera]GAB90263.1 hypothetical protein GORHZ_092_00120 [Gordonia rhizosphera NBRC 16068]
MRRAPPEQVAASEFAEEHRIVPAAMSVPGVRSAYVCRGADGAKVVISLADTETALHDATKAILATELLPGEDPALLQPPDRVEIYPVTAVYQPIGAPAN